MPRLDVAQWTYVRQALENANVRRAFVFALFWDTGRGIWLELFAGLYVFALTDGDAEAVGLILGLFGVCQMAAAAPAGYLADKMRRDRVLKAAGAVGAAACATTVLALLHDDLRAFAVGMALWGLFVGAQVSAMESLFADSLATGQRSFTYTARFCTQLLASVLGPAVAILLLLHLGDEWELATLRGVMLMSMAFAAGGVAIVFSFSDADSLGAASNEVDLTEESGGPGGEDDDWVPCVCGLVWLRRRWTPWFVAFADFVFSTGAGMSVGFFNLAFEEEYGLSPIAVTLAAVAHPVGTTVCSQIAQRMSLRTGRAFQVVFWHCLGTAVLIAICLSWGVDGMTGTGELLLFIARTGTMRATMALTKAILMDFATKESRGKWNAFESLSSFTWCGSAAVGGFIVDRWGYRTNFTVTAVIYVLGCVAYSALLVLVPKDELGMKAVGSGSGGGGLGGSGGSRASGASREVELEMREAEMAAV